MAVRRAGPGRLAGAPTWPDHELVLSESAPGAHRTRRHAIGFSCTARLADIERATRGSCPRAAVFGGSPDASVRVMTELRTQRTQVSAALRGPSRYGAARADPTLRSTELAGDPAEQHQLPLLVRLLVRTARTARAVAADGVERRLAPVASVHDTAVGAQRGPEDGLVSDAARRRHAAITTLSVIEGCCDPVGRPLMGESRWVGGGHPVM